MIVVEVKLWGTTIGALSMRPGQSVASFEYSPGFLDAGIEPSPIAMPVGKTVYSFPELSRTFKGLPGLFSDSLPDKFGNKIIDAWLTRQGRAPDSFTALERLCYTGNRGMGALEFYPAQGPAPTSCDIIEVENLRRFAASVLNQRKKFHGSFRDKTDVPALSARQQKNFEQILRIGTSAGGARAKILVACNETTGELRSGQVANDEGFTYWLLKLDDVENNGDKEGADQGGFGAIEFAYSQMAKAAGIAMTRCRLLENSGHRHFMTERFDRLALGKKIHYQSLAAIAHFDFNQAGAYSYEQAFDVARRLGLGYDATEEIYRRALFNICARNQDDHAKNMGFLMDKKGVWSLAPAFDVTYAYNPDGLWTGTHQMTFNGKRDNFTMDDFKAVAKFAGLRQNRYKVILEQVQEAVSCWNTFARQSHIPKNVERMIGNAHRFF
ncbi:MAG: type II toxin-antitoxin system HipA family toxin [Fibrobacter sp.]|nr:type II toxin-antitoxin system HipA family toxin [Fibrobacter sp.]